MSRLPASRQSPAFKQPETALLVACARLTMQPENLAAAAAAIDRHPDWSFFVRAAREHGIVALVCKHLQNLPSSMVPTEAQERLREETLIQARKNLRLAQELLALQDLFERHEIALIPLKGPLVAQQIYGSIAMRRIGDLDLLVRDTDVLRAVAVLQDRGYVSADPGKRDTDEVRSHATHELQPMVAKAIGCVVDLHHALVPPVGRSRIGFDEVLARSRATSFMGRSFLALAPGDLLVYLCEHGNGHLWNRLEWICSITELRRSGAIDDWDRVIAFATRVGGLKRLETACRLAQDLLDAPPPPAALATRRAAAPSAQVIDRYDADLGSVRSPAPSELFRYQLLTDQGLYARFDRVWKMVVLPRNSDIESLPLPRPLWPVYYFVRPFLIVWRLLRNAWQPVGAGK